MTRRFLGISEPTWRILAAGAVAALWMLVVWTATAYANDCAAYVKNPRNFVGNLQGLIEDCMRTGYVQAITTLLVGGIGGGGIVIAVNKGLKDAGKDWKDPNTTVPDGGDKEGGDKKDGDTPEAPPSTTGRDSVPEPCRSKWDDYRKATEEEFQKGKDVATVTNWYHHVVNNHLGNLAKVTIQLGMDAADMASAGAGAIKGGAGITKALLNLPETLSAIKNGLARAIAHSNGLETLIYNLFVEIGQLSSKGARLAGLADDAGRLSARAEERITEMIAGAAGLERDLAKYDELVRFSRSADSTMLERNGVSKSVAAADDALREGNRDHQNILNRKKALDDWAAAERAAIENEDARAFANKHDELGTDRSKLQKLQEEHAEAAKAAHKDWQDKMGELSAAKKELEEARAMAGHLQKAKQEKILADQEVRRAAGVRDEANTRLQHAEGELAGFDRAAKEMEATRATIKKLDEEIEVLTRRLEKAEAKVVAAQKKIDDAIRIEQEVSTADGAKALVDEKEAALVTAKAEKEAFDARPDVAGYQAKLDEAHRPYLEAVEFENQKEKIVVGIVDEQKALNAELAAELDSLGLASFDPNAGRIGAWDYDATLLPPDREAYYARRDMELTARLDPAVAENKAASEKVISSYAEWKRADAEIKSQHAAVLQEGMQLEQNIGGAESDLFQSVGAYQETTKIADPANHERIVGPLREEAKGLRQEGEAAMPKPGDPEAPDALKSNLDQLTADTNAKKYDVAKLPDKARIDYEHKVDTAKADVNQATKVHKDAEARLATAEEQLKIADLSGTGEPLDALRRVEFQQARYLDLVKEQEALRARYEVLKSGGDGPAAAALKERIDLLEGELAKWKNPDFETEAARRNPSKYSEWKAEQGGLDRIGESQAKITTLEATLTQLKAELATVERKLMEQQAKTGGKSTDELESEKARLAAELKEKQTALDTAKNEKKTQDQAKVQAEKEKEQAEADKKKKEAEKTKAEEEKRQSDEEIARYKRLQDNPVPPPEDVSWLGQKMHWVGEKTGIGQQWTPYHGSDAEAIGNKSHELRQKFDGVMDAITPDWLTWPFRKAGAKAGELFHKAFGGQSPEEVAAALKHGAKRVKEMEAQLKQVQDEFDALRKKAHDAKAALDQCCTINRPQVAAETN